jgi:MarR family transcriptional regulator, transcriptional regulator for hemolysin
MGADSSEGDASNPRRDLLLKLSVITRFFRNRFDQSMAELGVTRSQWTLIAVVARRPGLTQRVIAEALEIKEASAGRLIDRLCQEGLLTRQARDDDRRAYSVFLTDAAMPLVETLGVIARRNEEEAFGGVSDEELGALDGVLERIYRNVGGQKERLLG